MTIAIKAAINMRLMISLSARKILSNIGDGTELLASNVSIAVHDVLYLRTV